MMIKNRPPKILFIARDDGGCGFFRCRQPAAFIKRMGLADTEVAQTSATPEQLLSADLVVTQEIGSVIASNLANFMIENKIPFMTEIDDFLHHVSPNNAGGYSAWNPSTLYTHRAMEVVRKSMALTVSTNQLAREYFPYNANIFVVPNFLDQDKWNNPITRKADNKIRIGWCGGNAHADDLHMISKVIEKIVKEYKGQVIFETMGMTRQELAGVFPLKVQNEMCQSCGYEGEMHQHMGESLEDYPLVLASKGWDIALAPVIDNAFGNAKSDLKIKEYAATGLPIVASPITPYLEASKGGAEILFAESFNEWYNSIKELIDNPDKRSEIARKNKEWMSQHWIQDNAEHIFEVYKAVIARAESTLGIRESRLKNKK